jgi:hypothetical protein
MCPAKGIGAFGWKDCHGEPTQTSENQLIARDSMECIILDRHTTLRPWGFLARKIVFHSELF